MSIGESRILRPGNRKPGNDNVAHRWNSTRAPDSSVSAADARPPPNEKNATRLAKLVESTQELVVSVRKYPRLYSNAPPKEARPERRSPAEADRQNAIVKLNTVPFHIQSTCCQAQDPSATLWARFEAPLESHGQHLVFSLRRERITAHRLLTEVLAVVSRKVEVSEERPPLVESPRALETVGITESVAVIRNNVAVSPPNTDLDTDLTRFLPTFSGGSAGRDRQCDTAHDQPTQQNPTSQNESLRLSMIKSEPRANPGYSGRFFVGLHCNSCPHRPNHAVETALRSLEILACEYFY